MCGKMEIGCHIEQGFQAVAASGLEQLRQASNNAAVNTLESATFWLRPHTPAVAGQQGDNWTNSGTVEYLQHSLTGVTATVCVLAIVIAGMRIAWEQRAKPLQELLKAILTFVVVSAAGTATIQVLITWSDAFSVSIVEHAQKSYSLASAFGGTTGADGSPQDLVATSTPLLVAICISMTVLAASMIQMILMLVRSAMLVLLAGTFPLAAAATNTEIGRTWFRKFCGWSLAFIAYKPAAALVYAAAMMMARDASTTAGDAIVKAMTGVMMLLLAIVALPALLRFMVPVTAAVAGGSSGMGSAVADPGGMATGAVNVGSSGGFGGGSGRGAGSSAGGSAGGSGGGSGGGATGAQTVGAKAAGAKAGSAVAGPAGVGLAAARKAAGGLAGAAAHSAGESGGGSVTPASATGAMAGRSGGRASKPSPRNTHKPPAGQTYSPAGGRSPAGAGVGGDSGPSGGW